MRNALFIISLLLSGLLCSQVLAPSEDGLVAGEITYHFPMKIDTLENDILVLYQIQAMSNSDSIFITRDTSEFKKFPIKAKAVYVKKYLSLEYRDNTISHFINGYYVCSGYYRINGTIELESHYWGYYTFDSTGTMSSKVFESTHRINRELIECEDSVMYFFPNGNLMSTEHYEDCEKSGIWLTYDSENHIIKKSYYSKGELIKEEKN